MRKRLRKKKHLGEFQVFGIEVNAKLVAGTDYNKFLDDWIDQAVEAKGLFFGGSCSALELDGVLELGRRDVRDAKLMAITEWLHKDVRVANYQFGPLMDLYNET